MCSCFFTSIATIVSFLSFSLVHSSPLTTSSQLSLNRIHIPITQTLNSVAVLETSQPQNQPLLIGPYFSSPHPRYTDSTLHSRQRRHVHDETPQPQNSSISIQTSPTQLQHTNATPQQRHIVEETSKPSSTVHSPSLTQNSSVLRTRRQQNIIPDNLQLPNGPPLRFQRPRVSLHATRKPIRSQTGQQNRGDILQQRHGDVVQQSDLLVHSDKRPHGAPQKFCNMFGCDCVPRANAKCCDGYRYDKRANKCRQLG